MIKECIQTLSIILFFTVLLSFILISQANTKYVCIPSNKYHQNNAKYVEFSQNLSKFEKFKQNLDLDLYKMLL